MGSHQLGQLNGRLPRSVYVLIEPDAKLMAQGLTQTCREMKFEDIIRKHSRVFQLEHRQSLDELRNRDTRALRQIAKNAVTLNQGLRERLIEIQKYPRECGEICRMIRVQLGGDLLKMLRLEGDDEP